VRLTQKPTLLDIALRPQKATSHKEDADLREAWVSMERACWKLTVAVSHGSGMPGDQGAAPIPLVFLAAFPTAFCTAVNKMPGTTTHGNKRKADSDKANTEKVGFCFSCCSWSNYADFSGRQTKNAKTPSADPTDDEPESGPEGNDTPEPEATPATKKARGRRGKPKGAQKFTVGDESRLLDIVDVFHPIGGDMWERVSQQRSAFKL
jgi:hypothetical protein